MNRLTALKTKDMSVSRDRHELIKLIHSGSSPACGYMVKLEMFKVYILKSVVSPRGGGGHEGVFAPPQLETLPPLSPLVRRKKHKNQPFLAVFGGKNCPLRCTFCPLDDPHTQKKIGAATASNP